MDVVGDSQAKIVAVILPRCGGGSCGASWGWREVLPDPTWILKWAREGRFWAHGSLWGLFLVLWVLFWPSGVVFGSCWPPGALFGPFRALFGPSRALWTLYGLSGPTGPKGAQNNDLIGFHDKTHRAYVRRCLAASSRSTAPERGHRAKPTDGGYSGQSRPLTCVYVF